MSMVGIWVNSQSSAINRQAVRSRFSHTFTHSDTSRSIILLQSSTTPYLFLNRKFKLFRSVFIAFGLLDKDTCTSSLRI